MRATLLALLLTGLCGRALAESYAAYGLFATGSIRVIGMGGAFAALSNDATGMIFNPAGLSHGKWKYDFGASASQITNTELVESNLVVPPEQKYTSQFYSAAMRLSKSFAFGVGYNNPFNLNLDQSISGFSTITREINLESFDAAVAIRITKSLSFGATAHYETAKLSFQNDSLSIPLTEAENTLIYPTIGIAYHGKKFGVGVVYNGARNHDIDSSGNSIGSGTTFFQDVQVPAKTTVGIFYRFKKNLVVVVDYDMIDAPENAVTPSNTSGAEIALIEEKRNVLHGGLEYIFMDDKHTTVKMQAGGYIEPSRIDTTSSREHLTLGMEVRFGPVVLGVSYDQAKNFQNTAASFSMSLGDLK